MSKIFINGAPKDRSQEYKFDDGKLMMELIPPETFEAIARVLTYGANKYSPDSWKKVDPKRYQGALLRHLTAYMKDPNGVDLESGLLHIDHLLCNAAFLSYFVNKTIVESTTATVNLYRTPNYKTQE